MSYKYYYVYVIYLYILLSNHNIASQDPQKMIISSIITDLREVPEKISTHITLPCSDLDNPLQTSQLLLGEYVIAHEEYKNELGETWLRVNALQQKHFCQELGWQGYPGWILANHTIPVKVFPPYNLVIKNLLAPVFDENNNMLYQLSIGTRLSGIKNSNSDYWHVTLPNNNIARIHQDDIHELHDNWDLSESTLRDNIITTAKKFIGSYYSWGGRSAQTDQVQISSVDCSALIHLSFLAHGLQIPRMSHEQFLAACEIEHGANIQPGDLIFFSTIPNLKRIDLPHIDHVMLYIGDDMLLETTFVGDRVARIISCKKRLGKSITNMKSGDVSDTVEDIFYVYFASYLHDRELVLQLRENSIRYHAKVVY